MDPEQHQVVLPVYAHHLRRPGERLRALPGEHRQGLPVAFVELFRQHVGIGEHMASVSHSKARAAENRGRPARLLDGAYANDGRLDGVDGGGKAAVSIIGLRFGNGDAHGPDDHQEKAEGNGVHTPGCSQG